MRKTGGQVLGRHTYWGSLGDRYWGGTGNGEDWGTGTLEAQ
jgi:hypothetical protein